MSSQGSCHSQDVRLISPRKPNSLAIHRSSSSARKKKIKQSNCYFCTKSFLGKRLLDHLKKEKKCANLYMRLHKVNKFSSLASKIFTCEACFKTKNEDFGKHLTQNLECQTFYKKKYNLDNIEAVIAKNKALRRALLPSRTASARKRAYEKKKNVVKKSISDSLNDYRTRVMYANYKLCAICKTNCNNYDARELKSNEELFIAEKLDCPEKRKLRRFEKYFICSKCEVEERKVEPVDVNRLKVIHLCMSVNGDTIIYYPVKESNEYSGVFIREINEERIYLMMPSNPESTKFAHGKCISRQEVVPDLYKSRNITTSDMEGIYERQIFKFQQKDSGNECFVAFIKDLKNKRISTVSRLSQVLRISGSEEWKNQKMNELKSRHDVNGSLYLSVKIEVPHESQEVIATALIQEGFVISADQKGLSNGDFETTYLVHCNHKSDEDCSADNCIVKQKMEDFLEDDANLQFIRPSSLSNKHVGTYISFAHQKMMAFVKHIVQAPESGLFAEKFFFMLMFDENGQANIVGALWPASLDELNLDIARKYGDLTDEAKLVDFVENNLSVSVDKRLLRSSFHISEEESKCLAEIVLKHQFHLCDSQEECPTCFRSELHLPSLETSIKGTCSETNMKAAKGMRMIMQDKLKNMTREQKMTSSTHDWLEDTLQNVTGEISQDNNYLVISFPGEEDLLFTIDEVLTKFIQEYSESPLTAAYQYSLSRWTGTDESRVIMKRLRLVECFIEPFNPLFLKSSNSKVSITLSDNMIRLNKLLSSRKSEILNVNDPDLVFSHRLVSIEEAVCIADKTKKRTCVNTTSQYIDAKPKRRILVKKVHTKGENTFQEEGSADHFELVPSIISRHFSRMNGESLLLAETGIWFDYQGVKKSEDLFNLYKNQKIPQSDVQCVSSDTMLPEFLLCSNGDVLKKRKKSKVMILPRTKSKFDHMYQRCLLFLPIESEEVLLNNVVYDMYMELNKEGNETIVNVNERNLFNYKIQLPMKSEDQLSEFEGDYEAQAMANENCESESEGESNEEKEPLDFLLEALNEELN